MTLANKLECGGRLDGCETSRGDSKPLTGSGIRANNGIKPSLAIRVKQNTTLREGFGLQRNTS